MGTETLPGYADLSRQYSPPYPGELMPGGLKGCELWHIDLWAELRLLGLKIVAQGDQVRLSESFGSCWGQPWNKEQVCTC